MVLPLENVVEPEAHREVRQHLVRVRVRVRVRVVRVRVVRVGCWVRVRVGMRRG